MEKLLRLNENGLRCDISRPVTLAYIHTSARSTKRTKSKKSRSRGKISKLTLDLIKSHRYHITKLQISSHQETRQEQPLSPQSPWYVRLSDIARPKRRGWIRKSDIKDYTLHCISPHLIAGSPNENSEKVGACHRGEILHEVDA